jgi:hypothetical protein
MRLSKVAAFALIVGATGSMSVSLALAASDCSKLVELADWGENSSGDISVASGESCLFPITMRGMASSSEILQKPSHGKLKKLNTTTYEYKAKAKYKGNDTFAIKATGQGPTTSGTSVITVNATIK